MRLNSFQIKNYKIIDDTGQVRIDPNVTALVGRNESGKTAIMKALWKSRNVSDVKFDKLYDFPRDRYTKERSATQVVTVLEFGLSEQEATALAELLPGRQGQRPTKVTHVTCYEGRNAISSEIIFESGLEVFDGRDDSDAIDVDAEAPPSYESGGDDQAHGPATETHDWAGNATSSTDYSRPVPEGAGLTAIDRTNEYQSVSPEKASPEDLAQTKRDKPTGQAREWVERNLPTFIYYDDYTRLETLIHLPSYLARRDKPDATTRAQSALFEWTGLDPEEVLSLGKPLGAGEFEQQLLRRLEERRALVKAASFSLTGDWVTLWTGDEHRLEFDVDGDYLVLQVSDSHSPFPVPFEERSQGFQWFLSFYLIFLVESRKAHKDAILLLDEPGLHLHPNLQMRLVTFLDRIAETNQVIYSTHLPFLVDGNHFERVRTVYLSGAPPQTANVSNDVGATGDPDTLFPLQAGLCFAMAQSLALARWTVIVEGVTEFWLLRALHSCLVAAKDSDALDRDIAILPAGGIALMVPLGSLMLASQSGLGAKMLVLLNSEKGARESVRHLERVFGLRAPVMTVGNSLHMDEATLDDLVQREAYANAVQQTLEKDFTLDATELAAPTNVQALNMLFRRNNWGTFGENERAPAALWLAGQWADAGGPPKATLDRARALFRDINRHFKPEEGQKRFERKIRDRLLAPVG